jgi:uncharacterized cupredoxin-like copper-binding protein
MTTTEKERAPQPIEEELHALERDEKQLEQRTNQLSLIQGLSGLFSVVALILGVSALVVALIAIGKANDAGHMTRAASPGVATVAPAAPTAALPLAHVSGVTLREFTIAPSPAQVAAGKTSFTVHNGGQVKHEFIVLRTDKRAGSLLKGAEADETGNVGEIPNLPPGSTKTLRLNLKAGHYALICNLPGHYQAGQHADLTVR